MQSPHQSDQVAPEFQRRHRVPGFGKLPASAFGELVRHDFSRPSAWGGRRHPTVLAPDRHPSRIHRSAQQPPLRQGQRPPTTSGLFMHQGGHDPHPRPSGEPVHRRAARPAMAASRIRTGSSERNPTSTTGLAIRDMATMLCHESNAGNARTAARRMRAACMAQRVRPLVMLMITGERV